MFDFDVIRAWKDAQYRRSLSPAQLARLPENPAGLVELSDDKLKAASGMAGGPVMTTAINCTLYSFGNWRACGCGVATTAINCTKYTFQGWVACGC
jgi:mersacidin/lichenicidin family type 2 lantibiotic